MKRIELFGVQIDVMTMSDAVACVSAWIVEDSGRCRFVVTPNVDHTVMLQERADLRAVYQDADLVLADGWPVVAASRWLGKPLPGRVAGSDLVPALFANTTDTLRSVFLLGAMPGVGERAAINIHQQWPAVRVVGTYSPPLGFENDEQENQRILDMIAQANPDLLVVGLGAPKQELWVHAHRDEIRARAALCVGATIDFLAGEKARAPRWIQSMGLEWFHRMASEPRRLVKRYAHDAWVFPQLLWREWQQTAKRA